MMVTEMVTIVTLLTEDKNDDDNGGSSSGVERALGVACEGGRGGWEGRGPRVKPAGMCRPISP